MPEPRLAVYGVTAFDLFFTRCPCGELTVHGFWGQLTHKVIDRERKRATVVLWCGGCRRPRVRRFRLTTGRVTRHRLVRWEDVFWRVAFHLPPKWFRPFGRACMWLERRFPI